MKNALDSTLRAIDHANSKLGPISSLLDILAERVVPAVTASACGGVLCKTVCGLKCGPAGRTERFRYYSTSLGECHVGHYTCMMQDCGC